MVDQIGDQEQNRTRESGKHAAAVRVALAGLDEDKTGQKKNGAEGIQRRI